MIESLTLKNYRNLCLEPELTFDPLTIFVGPNGSGKTNLIRVLRFLQDAWIGAEDERRGVSRFESAVARWGGSRILDKSLEPPAVVGVNTSFLLQQGYTHNFNLELQVQNDNIVSVRGEEMRRVQNNSRPGRNVYYYHANIVGKNINIYINRKDPQLNQSELIGLKVENLPANELAVHGLQKWLEKWLEENNENSFEGTPFFEGKRHIEQFIREWTFYDAAQMNIDAIRKANPELGLGDRLLTPSGDNLALVLFNLSQDNIDFQDQMRQAMTQLFPQTRELRAVVTGRTSLTVEWYLHGIRKPFFLDEMSEGTIRMLCWAVILFSPKIPRLVVIDEPKASLHPAWLQVLAGWIREAARRTQIIISTHSPDLLDYFTEDRASVRVFDKDPQNPLYSRVLKLDEPGISAKIAEGWRLGDLYRVGDPQVGGWPW